MKQTQSGLQGLNNAIRMNLGGIDRMSAKQT